MKEKTYTNRHNARRAGVQAGIPRERIAITVHKAAGEVRFGFAEIAGPLQTSIEMVPPMPPTQTLPTEAPEKDVRNGVRRPGAGGLCRAVWDWLDAHPSVSVREALAVAPSMGWNLNNVSCEFYGWRRYNRTAPPPCQAPASADVPAKALNRAAKPRIGVGAGGA